MIVEKKICVLKMNWNKLKSKFDVWSLYHREYIVGAIAGFIVGVIVGGILF